MTTTSITNVNVGDSLLYVERYGTKPEVVVVEKVTPKGKWVKVKGSEKAFKPLWNGQWQSKGCRSSTYLYPNTPEKLAELTANYEQKQKEQTEKDEQRKAALLELEQREANELAEVKAVHNNELPIIHCERFNEDHAVYMLSVQVHERYQERKGPKEVLVVNVKKENESAWMGGKEQIAGYPTWTNKGTASFTSASAEYADTIEEVLWKAMHRIYFGGSW